MSAVQPDTIRQRLEALTAMEALGVPDRAGYSQPGQEGPRMGGQRKDQDPLCYEYTCQEQRRNWSTKGGLGYGNPDK